MSNTPQSNRGVTWNSPAKRGSAPVASRFRSAVTKVIGIAVAASMTLTLTGQVHETAAVDSTLSMSMVELLGSSETANPVTLNALRSDVFKEGFRKGDGSGIDIALIDTGVAPVAGLAGSNVVHGPDLSIEGAAPEARHLDSYGHGTHLAGIMVGQRPSAMGIAPGARVVSVKVAGRDGALGISQVIAAIDWVIEHRNADGLNIRILNLSLGQANVNSHIGDPLSAAVERAWAAGIFVVVAAGNSGDQAKGVDSPALDPYVFSVGASDSTTGRESSKQPVPKWSAIGDTRLPDAVVPGRSIASYRVPGSTIDNLAPNARVGNDLFLGSGTSQAAAVTSALAARLLSDSPGLDADDLKETLRRGAKKLENGDEKQFGKGRLLKDEVRDASPQAHETAAGPGSGLTTPTGSTWSGGSWSGGSWSGGSWSGGSWSAGSWSGGSWSGGSWSGGSWSGGSWSGGSWSGGSWS